ncbi:MULTISPECIES: DUF2796 domain-containing protein [Pseudomonas aeruginosa group]|uniref:DUF2796 domain-containing protein n=1 Tax=Pseudomonas aeruginosa group TaxID=136841 RepID=UPI000F1C761D|nr:MULTISPECIES: DUF2796 domain-containing protein [Pseudomonas aeruginosa group]MBG3903370.1 DUF2796 domain-containing protein [Pseudomonas aeruginosa]MBG4202814.1 DUF2796 domain-containing protein [Pseudomonas aeruginosa]MBG4280784.1 DUF2796 domain-containing protein [Pseudomonas aeruginosa]MBG6890900.1 DUF2796 domain-containing protein [Pseudomonas aeruginosa]MBM9935144.1 DUF2796 domain-containing protein [Pseudomonas aeruginosa]
MRPLLLALALLPFAVQAHDDHDHDHTHGSLGKHEHGVAQLNVALEGKSLELELDSPAMNLVGFEHAASSEADKAAVAKARAQLEKPLELFALPDTAGCSVASQELRSPLFGDKAAAHAHEEKAGHEHEHEHGHADIHAHYRLSCEKPELLKLLTLAEFFKRFPATQKIQVQLIGPDGQKGADLAPASAELKL